MIDEWSPNSAPHGLGMLDSSKSTENEWLETISLGEFRAKKNSIFRVLTFDMSQVVGRETFNVAMILKQLHMRCSIDF